MNKEHKDKIIKTMIKCLLGGLLFYFVLSQLILLAHHHYYSEALLIDEGAKPKR